MPRPFRRRRARLVPDIPTIPNIPELRVPTLAETIHDQELLDGIVAEEILYPMPPVIEPRKGTVTEWKCKRHLSNDGFWDEDGKWNCWSCYREDPISNPKGKILDEYKTSDRFTLRMVLLDTTSIVEQCDLKTRKVVRVGEWRDISQTTREFNNLKRNSR